MKRRIFVKSGLAALVLAGVGGASGAFRSLLPQGLGLGGGIRPARAAGLGFQQPLPIPPLLENLSDRPDQARFAMQAQEGSRRFFSGRQTRTMGYNGEQVYHGLAWLFLIEDEVSDSLDIPREYGVDDIPVVLQDRRFLPMASLPTFRGAMMGQFEVVA